MERGAPNDFALVSPRLSHLRMARTVSFASASLSLSGNRWHIQAGDPDAARVLKALANAMSLPLASSPAQQGAGEPCRELRVLIDPGLGGPASGGYESGPVFCHLPPPENHDLLVIGMSLVAQAVARAELSRGGFLVHGALAQTPDRRKSGIILAGPGTVGKTTASNRLPLPWRALSDDTTLVLRDDLGQYMAHPWPTWSRFFPTPGGEPGPGGSWDVQNGLPLKAVFFLAQAAEDRIVPLAAAPAVAYLMQTMQHVTLPLTPDLPADQARSLPRQQLAAAEELVRTVPASTLHLSLTGTFWKLIEENLAPVASPSSALPEARGTDRASGKNSSPLLFRDNRLAVTYYGPSMNPTLRHPDLLEVVPYGGRPVRRGDVVYYLPPTGGAKVIHRVVQVTARGICTRGDGNCTVDPYRLQPSDIIGRVTAAWRHDRRRKIAGGPRGVWAACRARLRLRLHSLFSPLLHGLYHTLAASGLPRRILPASLRPRVFEFRQGDQPSLLKLMAGGQVIGRYNAWQQRWEIDRPWLLLIDASLLPVVDFSPAKDALGSTLREQAGTAG